MKTSWNTNSQGQNCADGYQDSNRAEYSKLTLEIVPMDSDRKEVRQALEVVRKACNNKGYYVVDADIEKFFDNVNQDKLMETGRAENIRP